MYSSIAFMLNVINVLLEHFFKLLMDFTYKSYGHLSDSTNFCRTKCNTSISIELSQSRDLTAAVSCFLL